MGAGNGSGLTVAAKCPPPEGAVGPLTFSSDARERVAALQPGRAVAGARPDDGEEGLVEGRVVHALSGAAITRNAETRQVKAFDKQSMPLLLNRFSRIYLDEALGDAPLGFICVIPRWAKSQATAE